MSEQAMALKAFLLGIPIRAGRDVFTRHLYRTQNPVEDASKAVWRNVARSMSVLLEAGTFDPGITRTGAQGRNPFESHT